MLTPAELEAMPIEAERLFKDLESRVMSDVVRRLKNNGNEIIRSADWQIYRMNELGKSKEEIKQYIQDVLKLTDDEVNSIYDDVIKSGYTRNADIYKALGASFIPYSENKELQQLVSALKEQTNSEFKNITNSLGFATKGADGKISFSPIADYYQKTLDNAMMDIASGTFDYNTVLKRTVTEMTNSGLRTVDYASSWSNRVDVAARRAVMTGITQLTGKVNEQMADDLETDTYEVSWHSGARPSHAEWQGGVYTKEELETVCGLGSGEGLCGWNCYHSYSPFIPGVSVRTYTDEELKEMRERENTPKDYYGKKYTAYEASQRQRHLETAMRAQRQKIKLLQEGGADEDDIITARARYRGLSQEYAQFSKAMDLPQQRERIYGDGLGNIGKGKYTKSVANSEKSGIIKVLPNVDSVVIPESKFTGYALNPLKDVNKANAFNSALGYNMSNANDLITNIKEHLHEFSALEKPDNGFGKRYEVLMTLTGANNKKANVKTAWIVDKDTKETRLTSAYVTKKKFKENDDG